MNILIDLSCFYSDFRKMSLVYIDFEKTSSVSDFLSHVSQLFKLEEFSEGDINTSISLFAGSYFIHPNQPIDILKNLDTVRLNKTNFHKEDFNNLKREDTKDEPVSVEKVKRKWRKSISNESKSSNSKLKPVCSTSIDEDIECSSTQSKSKKKKKKNDSKHSKNEPSKEEFDKNEDSYSMPIHESSDHEQRELEVNEIDREDKPYMRKKRKHRDIQTQWDKVGYCAGTDIEEDEGRGKTKKKKLKKNRNEEHSDIKDVEHGELAEVSIEDNISKHEAPDFFQVKDSGEVLTDGSDVALSIKLSQNFSNTFSNNTIPSHAVDFSIPLKKVRKRKHNKMKRKAKPFAWDYDMATTFKPKSRKIFNENLNTHILFNDDNNNNDDNNAGMKQNPEPSTPKCNMERNSLNVENDTNISSPLEFSADKMEIMKSIPKYEVEKNSFKFCNEKDLNIFSDNINIFENLEKLESSGKCTSYSFKNRFKYVKTFTESAAPCIETTHEIMPGPPTPLHYKFILSEEAKCKFSQLLALECLSSPIRYSKCKQKSKTQLNVMDNENYLSGPLFNSSPLPLSFSSNRLKNCSTKRKKKTITFSSNQHFQTIQPSNIIKFNGHENIIFNEKVNEVSDQINHNTHVEEGKTVEKESISEDKLTGFTPKSKIQRSFHSLGNFLSTLKEIHCRDENLKKFDSKNNTDKNIDDASSPICKEIINATSNENSNSGILEIGRSVKICNISDNTNDIHLIKDKSIPKSNIPRVLVSSSGSVDKIERVRSPMNICDINDNTTDISLLKDESSPKLHVPQVLLYSSSSDEESTEVIKRVAEQDINYSKVPSTSTILKEVATFPKQDLSTYPLIKSLPKSNDIIAFKVITLDQHFCTTFSKYRPAKVMAVNGIKLRLQYLDKLNRNESKIDGEPLIDVTCDEDEVEIDWRNVIEPRLVFP